MNRLGFFVLLLAVTSCSVTNKSGLAPEDELFVTRRYVGNFVAAEVTKPSFLGSPHVIVVTTTLDSLFGKISAYSKKCDFLPGDRLYIRRVYQASDVFGSWIYQLENDKQAKVCYKISEFQNGDKVLAQDWY